MNGRKERGQEIAAKPGIRKTSRGYIVPSQSGQGKYAVTDADAQARCTCPDFELRGEPCKHIWAVRIVIQQSFVFDGETVTETVSITKTVKQTYVQDWPAYNAAQTNEQDKFQILLRDLCLGLPEPEQKRGRPRLSPRDAVFAAVFKVYTTVSCSSAHERSARGPQARIPQQAAVP